MLAKRIAQVVVCLAPLAIYLALPATLFAQAWTPPKGEGSLSFTYQKVDVRDHFDAEGDVEDRGRIHTHNTILAVEYGLTDNLALGFDVAYIASRFDNLGVRRPHGPVDDGFYHPTFQDVHLDLRYNAVKRPLMITPFVGVTVPTHDYEVRGHSAVGRRFKELMIGLNVGRELSPILPNTYVHVRYSLAILKRFAGLNLNHSNADWEVGWAANRKVTLRFIGGWQKAHGGFEFPDGVQLTPAQFEIHDRVAKADYLQMGAGVTYSIYRSFDIHAAYAKTVIAKNTHGDGGIVLGFSWRFWRGHSNRIAVNTLPVKFSAPPQGMF